MSYLLTADVAKQAVEMVEPIIYTAMGCKLFKRDHLHIVVMDPAAMPINRNRVTFKSAILYEVSLGNTENWEHDYAKIARSKAQISWWTKLPTHIVQETMPYILTGVDTKHYGSVVLDGIVVAASGVQPWYDECVSHMVAAACRAFSIENMQEDILPSDSDFLGTA
ncbi:hypothetical protein IIB50_02275 [Patescibacteria group bacterium]|nr:hypothetical protein [Patescibacteria group bacterium]